jgi:hypothetical protein
MLIGPEACPSAGRVPVQTPSDQVGVTSRRRWQVARGPGGNFEADPLGFAAFNDKPFVRGDIVLGSPLGDDL